MPLQHASLDPPSVGKCGFLICFSIRFDGVTLDASCEIPYKTNGLRPAVPSEYLIKPMVCELQIDIDPYRKSFIYKAFGIITSFRPCVMMQKTLKNQWFSHCRPCEIPYKTKGFRSSKLHALGMGMGMGGWGRDRLWQ